ncbi:MAG TPA: polysaccharide deacetylase family protein [Candidatus Saccharimonadales bacterium]
MSMKTLRHPFRWLSRPQLLIVFIMICLCVGGLGVIQRSRTVPVLIFDRPLPSPLPVPVTQASCNIVPCVALTFDDGPDPTVTPRVLDILARHQVHATFFIVGSRVAGHEPIVRRAYQAGHEIGNHSWNHPDLSTLPPEQVEEQLTLTQHAIADAGVPMPRILRPPYGAVNEMVAAHNHLSVVRWNVDPEDWKNHNAPKLTEQIVATARPGAIILLHDIYPSTADALDAAMPRLKQQYQLITVSQLLNLSPGDQGQYFSRHY